MKRCFGVDRDVGDCDWAFLSTLRMHRDPAEGMPRLRDLLAWLADDEEDDDDGRRRQVWLLLDIKVRNV